MKLTASQTLAMKHEEHEATDRTLLGFWIYLMTDCVLFASLFASYMVLRGNTFGGPSGRDLFDLNYVMYETMALLVSSFACGLAMINVHRGRRAAALQWFGITFVLGALFLGLELNEFHHLVAEGNSWRRSGFLSGYFTLVATHGLHITVGLLWMVIMMLRVVSKGFTGAVVKRLTMLSLFWHFLDIVWIFIFTIVYLTGALPL